MRRLIVILYVLCLSQHAWATAAVYELAPPVVSHDSLLSCHREIRLVEAEFNIPIQLLEAVALTESSRMHPVKKQVVAWPWTVMAEGRGRYFDKKQDAINEVRMLQAKGVKNIDVGCMQINLHFHPNAFTSLEQAFDPFYNVRYAAKFLTELKKQHNTWSNAVGRYHSSTPEHFTRYRDKVMGTWRDIRRQLVFARRQEALQVRQQALIEQGRQEQAMRIASYRPNLAPNQNYFVFRGIPNP